MQHILVELIITGEVQARRLAFWPQFVLAFLAVTGETAVLGCPATVLPTESRNTPGWERVKRVDLAGPLMVFPGTASDVAQERAWDPSLVNQSAGPRSC